MLKGRKVVPTCLICGKKIVGTPKSLAGWKRELFHASWIEHLTQHLYEKIPRAEVTVMLPDLIRTAFRVSRVAEDNR